MTKEINNSQESKAARAVIMNYEGFMLALWLWNYMGDTTLAEKRKIVKTLRSQPLTVWEYVRHARPCLPNPEDMTWKECVKAAGFPVTEIETEGLDELSDVIKMKLNLKETT